MTFLVGMRSTLMLVTLSTIGGCTTTITPPDGPPHPTTILVTDYGRHSSLILPDSNGEMIEYAFGDWNWYALGHTDFFAAIAALVHSKQSTLGRRRLLITADAPNVNELIGSNRSERVVVDGDRVKVLLAKLDQEYEAHAGQAVFNAEEHFYFVPSRRPYNVFHNCNHVTAEWLAELGARIHGPAILSHFRVVSEDEN